MIDFFSAVCLLYGYPVCFGISRSKRVLIICYCVTVVSLCNLIHLWLRFVQNWLSPSPSNASVLDRISVISQISGIELLALAYTNFFHLFALIRHRKLFKYIFKNGQVFGVFEKSDKIVVVICVTAFCWLFLSQPKAFLRLMTFNFTTSINHLIIIQFCAVQKYYSTQLMEIPLSSPKSQNRSIFSLIEKYLHITCIVHRANHEFRYQILVAFSGLFIDIPYITVYFMLQLSEGMLSPSLTAYFIHHIAVRFVLMVYFLRSCSQAKRVADDFYAQLFGKVRARGSYCKDRRVVLFLTRRLTLNLTACGFFTYGYPLLSTITASLTTYLVILLQFSVFR